MAEAAKFTEYFVLVFCTLLMPKDTKESSVTIMSDSGPGETVRLIQIEGGYEIQPEDKKAKRIGTITPIKGKPGVFELKVGDRVETVDLSAIAAKVAPVSLAARKEQ